MGTGVWPLAECASSRRSPIPSMAIPKDLNHEDHEDHEDAANDSWLRLAETRSEAIGTLQGRYMAFR